MIQLRASEAVAVINEKYRDGIRLGEGGPLIRSTSLDFKPAMIRSDGKVVVVEHALKRHRALVIPASRTLTLVSEEA